MGRRLSCWRSRQSAHRGADVAEHGRGWPRRRGGRPRRGPGAAAAAAAAAATTTASAAAAARRRGGSAAKWRCRASGRRGGHFGRRAAPPNAHPVHKLVRVLAHRFKGDTHEKKLMLWSHIEVLLSGSSYVAPSMPKSSVGRYTTLHLT